ncbi:TPA: hypothetical protein NJ686_004583 [Vibrio parahaemolyticus]|nr:hypothetical protein [Vibrio parahaemolyticus]
MSYKRARRYIHYFKNRGFSASQIADQLNMSGLRQPGNRRLFDAKAVDDMLGRNSKSTYE